MSAPRLSRAVGASAMLHLAVLGALAALAHPPASSSPPLRVSLMGTAAPSTSPPGESGSGPAPAGAETTEPERPRPPPAPTRAMPRPARRTGSQGAPTPRGAGSELAEAVALVAPVQSDVWMLTAPASPAGTPAAGTRGPAPSSDVAGGKAGPAGDGPAQGASPSGDGPGGSSTSLLATLSQRLAWSAARCAPPTVVRTARHALPAVPLHFCLDAAGRPSDVGLLGTTGSDALDRAARECVVPGALPLPPAPGCYTVEVRFPIRE